MYPQDVPDIIAEEANLTYIDNSYDAIKNVCPALAGGKNHGFKQASNIKDDNNHENWYLACEAYGKLASQDINIKRSYFLNYSHCDA